MTKKIIITSILIIILIISILSTVIYSWDLTVKILIFCMLTDYLIGISMSIIGKSKKGNLKSKVGYEGIVKKSVMLFIVTIAGLMQILLKVNHIQDTITLAFIFNELVSIGEHAKALGIPIIEITELLKKKGDKKNDDK